MGEVVDQAQDAIHQLADDSGVIPWALAAQKDHASDNSLQYSHTDRKKNSLFLLPQKKELLPCPTPNHRDRSRCITMRYHKRLMPHVRWPADY